MSCVLVDGFGVHNIVIERITKHSHALIVAPVFSIRMNIVMKDDVTVLCLCDSHGAAQE